MTQIEQLLAERPTHITITPNESEVIARNKYADANKSDVWKIAFVTDESDEYLSKCKA